MASLNQVFIIGRLGRDPELKYSQSGAAVCNLNIATDESFTDRDGNKVDRVEWHRVTAFQKTAENCANFLAKGSLVHVSGSLTTRKWQDQQGQDRFTTEIKADRVQFLDRKGDNQSGGQSEQPATTRQHAAQRGNAPRQQPEQQDNFDSVPF
jgi:single-strand DNA-binding protein